MELNKLDPFARGAESAPSTDCGRNVTAPKKGDKMSRQKAFLCRGPLNVLFFRRKLLNALLLMKETVMHSLMQEK